MPPRRYDEIGPFSATFLVEVDGHPVGEFAEVSGLELTVDTSDEYEEGGQNGYVHKLPGRISWPNLVLKRGVTENHELLDWVMRSSGEGFAAGGNRVERTTAAVTLVAPDGTRLRAWEFEDAFPVRWSGPNLSAGSADPAIEELEIAHHGFRARDV
ncbi:MAG TPA: phage tail protein [Acidimicrobiales bacterium]|nr:phage tail protein [Acidimicrobiales bacterium]